MKPTSEPFWDALSDGRFVLPVCADCDEAFFPPAPVCPRCHADAVEWVESDAEGSLYAFTRQHRTAPGVDEPAVIGLVELDDGPRLLARIAADYDALDIGLRVRIHPCAYDGNVDRGRLEDRPFIEARLQ